MFKFSIGVRERVSEGERNVCARAPLRDIELRLIEHSRIRPTSKSADMAVY